MNPTNPGKTTTKKLFFFFFIFFVESERSNDVTTNVFERVVKDERDTSV